MTPPVTDVREMVERLRHASLETPGDDPWMHLYEQAADMLESLSRARGMAIEEAAKEMLADHMTSEKHHPGYVLVPAAAFEKLCSALPSPAGGED